MPRIRKQEGPVRAAAAAIVWLVAVYIRLSREDGKDESDSVVNQKKILSEYMDQYFDGQYEIVDFYIDDGLTGTDDSRESFMRMFQDIEAGRVNCVLVKTLSRAFRNYADQGYYLEYYFPQKNVRFISTGDPKIDTYTNPEAITGLEVPITGLMNDRFAAKTSSDIRRTFDHKRRNGEFIGAFAPYGYLKDPNDKNCLIIDEEIAPIKREILQWFIRDGMSLNGIAHRLNEQGVLNPTAYKRSKGMRYANPKSEENDGLWTGQTVRRMLTEKVNLGHMVQGRYRIVSYKVHDQVRVPEEEWYVKENTHEATFTQEEFDALTRLLQRDTRTANGSRQVYLFSGLLKCRDCGKALQRKTAKDITYYCCRTYTEKSKTRCTKHSIRLDILERAVLDAVQNQIAFMESLEGVIDEITSAPVSDAATARIEKALLERQREIARAKALSDGLYEDYKTELIDKDEYLRMKAKYREQAANAEEMIARLRQEQRELEEGGTLASVFEVFLKHRNVQVLDRALLLELIETIFVHEDKKITVRFRFTEELDRVMEYVAEHTPRAENG